MKRSRNPLKLAAVWFLFGALAVRAQAAAPAPPPETPAKAAESILEFHDDLGRRVRLPAVPQRIVSLAPNLTETVFALDLGARLAGVTDFCDYPPEARTRARVGGPINPNLEEIVSLHPDLVLATRVLNRAETVEALDRLGIPVYTTDPRTVEDVVASVRRLGEVLGAKARGDALATQMQQRLAGLALRLRGLPLRRVFFVVWLDPLISTGPHTFIADAIRHAGAESVVNVAQDWPQINLEEVLRQNPDYLVFAGEHQDDPQATIDSLKKRPGWSSLEAVRLGHFAVVSDALDRPAPRMLDAIEDLARQLHPEAFAPAAAPPAAPSPHRELD
ncbi:MAG TPA: cobalamin-binding protein [Candidatus Acidoferrales bacterium]|nr:cobalamin-binding protein [Candidatus Acidoferrales bacterium]